ncbi:MAG: glycosyltransferase family 2 protein [Actinomycetes bacterium]
MSTSGPESARRVPCLSIVLPAWNEDAGLLHTLDAVGAAADALVAAGEVGRVEVVVVDDGSTDATPALLAARAASDQRLQVVTHDRNRGLGAGVRSGLAKSTGDVVLYTDADLPFDLAAVPTALEAVRGGPAGMVALYRVDRAGEGLRRLVYSYVYNLLVRAVLGVRVRDVNFAGKFLVRDLVDALELHSEGSFIDAEMVARAERLGFGVAQFGVEYFPRSRGVSTLSSLPVVLGMLREMRTLTPGIRSLGPRPGRR